MKVYIVPTYSNIDKGDGGIRRCVEAQQKYLPQYGIEVVDNMKDADIVNTHAAEILDVPVDKPWIMSCHGLYWQEYRWPAWGARVNSAVIEVMKRADAITAPSEWVAYALQRGMWLRPTVLPHGIEPRMWKAGENKGYVLWNKAREDSISNPADMNKLAEMVPDIQFLSTFGAATKNVIIMGKKPFEEAKKDIRNAAVYLVTARETFGIGTLEAMACGVPILGWNYGGQAEIIKHGETGWLSPYGDYENLKQGLIWCLENREEIGKAARRDVVKRFTWEKAIARYADLYHQVYERHINKKPKVSVVVPCHNLARFLPEMVKSVKEQTLTDWEMIIADDSTEDNSYELASRYAAEDKRIKAYHSDINLKLPGSLNYGFQYAKGKYIMNLDPDNMIPPRTLSVLSTALDNDRSIHVAYGRIKFVLEDGVIPDPVTGTPDGISRWPTEFNCIFQFRHRNQIPCNAMMRREVRERTGGYRDRAKVAEDAEFWTRAVSYGFQPKKVTEDLTLIYRYRPDSKSRGETEPDWTSWMPWTRNPIIAPWGVAEKPPVEMRCWPVPSCAHPLVTVIIPVGPGHEKLVIDALDSVEGQIFRQWDCIVVNDTGGELKVPHPWVKVLGTKGKEGPSAARNMGIAACRTRAFVCLDADDIMEPDCLKLMWDIWKETGGIVYSHWWDDKGDKIDIWTPPEWEPTKLITDGCIFASCAMYDKSDWQKIGGFDPRMQNWEDWDYQIALALNGVCAYRIEKPLWTYRKTTGYRREEAAGDKARGEKEMRAKWPDMWDGNGKEKLTMACGGCGQRKRSYKPTEVVKSPGGNLPTDGATLLEFIGASPKSLWIGKKTGKKYYFGNDDSHRRMFVFNADVEGFLAMNKKFARIEMKPKEERKPVLAGVMGQ